MAFSDKKCLFCNEPFQSRSDKAKFCNIECSNNFNSRFKRYHSDNPNATVEEFAAIIAENWAKRSVFRQAQTERRIAAAKRKAEGCAARYAAAHPNHKKQATPRGSLTEAERKKRESERAAARYAAKHPDRPIRAWVRRSPPKKPEVSVGIIPKTAVDKKIRVFCRHDVCTDRAIITVRTFDNGNRVIVDKPKNWLIDMIGFRDDCKYIVICEICDRKIGAPQLNEMDLARKLISGTRA